MRVGARKTPLHSLYRGPFKVLERREKYFKLDLGNRHDMVSLDRIKPAFMDAKDTIEPVPLYTHTLNLQRCSGSGSESGLKNLFKDSYNWDI